MTMSTVKRSEVRISKEEMHFREVRTERKRKVELRRRSEYRKERRREEAEKYQTILLDRAIDANIEKSELKHRT